MKIVKGVKDFLTAYKEFGSIKGVARNTDLTYHRARKLYQEAVEKGKMEPQNVGAKPLREAPKDEVLPPVEEGNVSALGESVLPLPPQGKIYRYLLTSAQNNTAPHKEFWDNLNHYASQINARVFIGRYTYVKTGLGASGDKAKVTKLDMESLYGKSEDELHYAQELMPYFVDHRVQLAPGLVWCGEMNILPTAVNPLSGLEVYTGRSSSIFPHAKVAMQSVPSMKFEDTKFIYTTGTVTKRNYIQRKAGLKAEFHHCYGAIIVEVDSRGRWWCRQINSDDCGTFYDLDAKVTQVKGKPVMTTGNRVEALTWGDIHAIRVSPEVLNAGWMYDDSLVKVLNPKYQFLHDLIDFRSQNHHDQKDPFKKYAIWKQKESGVEKEILNAFSLAASVHEEANTNSRCSTYIVDSNHDRAVERWLRESDWKHDPENAMFYLECALAKVNSLSCGDKDFHLIEWLWEYLLTEDTTNLDIHFLKEDQSKVVAGVEMGMHGHLGPNGSRGSVNAFARLGRRANIGHSHTAAIKDGVYQAGTSSLLDLGYNSGPSSWSHSLIITYPNGKRTIVTMYDGKWRA